MDCFLKEADKLEFDMSITIFTSDIGGACVGVLLTDDDQIIAKAMPCAKKAFFACQGETIRSATNILRSQV